MNPTRSAWVSRIRAGLVDAAAISAAWAGLLYAENVALGFLFRDQFSGIWEIALSRRALVPIAAAALAPASLAVVAGWEVARRAREGSRDATRLVGTVALLAAMAIGVGVTGGRHFANLGVRGAFVALLGAVGFVVGAWLVPQVTRLRGKPLVLGVLGFALAVGAWLGDEYVLPRLYPAFHAALGGLTLLGAAAFGMAIRDESRPTGRAATALASLVAVVLIVGAATSGRAGPAFDRASNLRRVLVERAPLLGVAVEARAAWRRSPDAEPAAAAAAAGPSEIARSLDWSGHDVVLVTIDATRADHVSAYGYPRPTTPNIDALAREGALFESAYCATPHTSYSLTSTMTGKYLRPLLALGLGEDSETWAQDMRRYGWRTAAFYPPAVFYIDQARFTRFEQAHLGFEYAKVEFADPELREKQVAAYLASEPVDRPLFLWVHFFEPHEPYVAHPEHPFSGAASRDIDDYDSEIATADDGVGRIVRLARARRPDPVIIVTADHGEEFGEHGGRYHGTTVYEEQVRVPLVVVGPGVRAGARIGTVVQSIDLLPTALSALGLPRPARVRGRDLGPLLAGKVAPGDRGFAFAETDDYALVASGDDRLICERRAAACELFRPAIDPREREDFTASAGGRAAELRALLRATERDHGRYEAGGASPYPEALRRGMQGEVDAAQDVASLLDDADVGVRRKAAEVCLALHAAPTLPALRRAFARDEDEQVRRWSALALARMGDPVAPLVDGLLHDTNGAWRRAAAVVLGGRGDARACDELSSAWAEAWPDTAPADEGADGGDGEPRRLDLELATTKDWLDATVGAKCRSAVPALTRALEDVRARPYVADALGRLGDDRARTPLLARLADEPYVTTRPHEARALLALGAHDWSSPEPVSNATVSLSATPSRSRVAVLVSDANAEVTASVGGLPLNPVAAEGEVRTFDIPAPEGAGSGARTLRVEVRSAPGGVLALWLVAPPRLISAAGSRK